jgi:lysophospholipase L1-like esterase
MSEPRSKIGAVAAVVFSFALALPVMIILALGGGSPCGTPSGQAPAPSAQAEAGIPTNYLAIYQATGAKYGIPWTLLAGIGSVESDHGRGSAPGIRSGVNQVGNVSCCAGPMQFNIRNGPPSTWDAYGVDGNGDGRIDVYDPNDAIPAAAHYLKASGAPEDLHRAVFAYNHSEAYFQEVTAKMREYASSVPTRINVADTTAAATTPGVLNLGDSLGVGLQAALTSQLAGEQIHTLALTNRTSTQGLHALRDARDHLPGTFVVSLGTNDGDTATFRANVLSILAIARRGQATVLWFNISRPSLGRGSATDDQLNAVLADVASTHPELHVLDWHAAVASGRVTLADDVHPTPAGYATRATLATDAISGPDPSTSDDIVGAPTGDCGDAGGAPAAGQGDGSFTIDPGANRPEQGLQPALLDFVARMATFYTGRLVLTTGTRHNPLTADGNISDHWTGFGADFGMVLNGGTNDGPVGDAIATAAFQAAGLPRDIAAARGRAGGLINLVVSGWRVQIIWKADDHHDHVHAGVKQIDPNAPNPFALPATATTRRTARRPGGTTTTGRAARRSAATTTTRRHATIS